MGKDFFNNTILPILNTWSEFGETLNDVGTRLIGHAPHIAPKAYVNVIYSPISSGEFDQLIERLGRDIPDQYGDFLKCANGAMIYSGSLRVFGYTPINRKADTHVYNYASNVILPNVTARIKGLAEEAVVVGFYKEDGSHVSIEGDGSVVRFDSQGDGSIIQKWPDFNTWLSSEVEALDKSLKRSEPWVNSQVL